MTRVSPGSITTDPAARADRSHGMIDYPHRTHRIEQLRACDEHDAGRCQREKIALISRINFNIAPTAFDSAHRDREDHQPRLEAGLDDEQSGDTLKHGYG